MAVNTDMMQIPILPPPRSEAGAVGWLRTNLFSTWYNGALTVAAGAVLVLAAWFGLKWVVFDADWRVIVAVGGRFVIGNYNSDQACPGNDCFWRPQASLLMVSMLLGMAWGVAGTVLVRRIAVLTAAAAALFALLPYGLDRMGWDVRLLLLANPLMLGLGWSLSRYTRLGTIRWVVILSVAAFVLTILLLLGLPGVPGLQPVDVRSWGGLTLNLLLATAGIVLSLPIGILLALGRRSRLPVVKALCVGFIEVFRGVR